MSQPDEERRHDTRRQSDRQGVRDKRLDAALRWGMAVASSLAVAVLIGLWTTIQGLQVQVAELQAELRRTTAELLEIRREQASRTEKVYSAAEVRARVEALESADRSLWDAIRLIEGRVTEHALLEGHPQVRDRVDALVRGEVGDRLTGSAMRAYLRRLRAANPGMTIPDLEED